MNDSSNGNIVCDTSKGCIWESFNNELSCNGCKNRLFPVWFKSPYYSCSEEIDNCKECLYETYGNKTKVICDTCYDMFLLNETKDGCNLRDCKEYSEISFGCMICQDILSEYQQNNKCQFCNDGYFLTKEGTCLYCRSENFGGSVCYECGYEEDDEII